MKGKGAMEILGFGRNKRVAAALCAAALLLADGCKKKEESQTGKGPRAVPVTAVKAELRPVEIREESVGYIEGREAPAVSAEVSGRVSAVLADNGAPVNAGDVLAKIDDGDLKLRHEAALAAASNAEKNVARLKNLFAEKVIPESQLDDAQTQLTALRSQLAAAARDLKRAAVTAPLSGKVQSRLVAEGDYVNPGKPMFVIAAGNRLQIHLPFPESLANRFAVGQAVRLASPTDSGTALEGRISEIRPVIASGSRAVDVIVNRDNPGGWMPGASVTGSVLLGSRQEAVMVPALCVILRPAGETVYIIAGDKTRAVPVKTGVRQDGMVEIVSGLKGDETLAADGAGFLTDGAAVKAAPVADRAK